MKHTCLGCLLTIISAGVAGALLVLGGYAYYRAYPLMRGALFVTLGVCVLGVLWSLPRLFRAHTPDADAETRCRACEQASTLLEWCVYETDIGPRWAWLCRDCQNQYCASAEA
jgi:uncharacterized membrane protein